MKTESKKKNNIAEAIQTGVGAAVGAGIGVAGATVAKEAMAQNLQGLDLEGIVEDSHIIDNEIDVDDDSIFDSTDDESQGGNSLFDTISQAVAGDQAAPESNYTAQSQQSYYDNDDSIVEVVDVVGGRTEDTIMPSSNDSSAPDSSPMTDNFVAPTTAPEVAPQTPSPTTTTDSEPTGEVNITSITVDDQEVILMDTDGDGIVDIMAVDSDGDMLISDDEKTDISEDGFAIADAQSLEQELAEGSFEQEDAYASANDDNDYYQAEDDAIVSDENAEDYYMADGSYTIDNSLSDYNNQANVNDYMA